MSKRSYQSVKHSRLSRAVEDELLQQQQAQELKYVNNIVNDVKRATQQALKQRRIIDQDQEHIVEQFTSPLQIFPNESDVLNMSNNIRFFVYSMGAKKIIFYGYYNQKLDKLIINNACRYEKPFKISEFFYDLNARNYKYLANTVKDRILVQFNPQHITGREDIYLAYKAFLSGKPLSEEQIDLIKSQFNSQTMKSEEWKIILLDQLLNSVGTDDKKLKDIVKQLGDIFYKANDDELLTLDDAYELLPPKLGKSTLITPALLKQIINFMDKYKNFVLDDDTILSEQIKDYDLDDFIVPIMQRTIKEYEQYINRVDAKNNISAIEAKIVQAFKQYTNKSMKYYHNQNYEALELCPTKQQCETADDELCEIYDFKNEEELA